MEFIFRILKALIELLFGKRKEITKTNNDSFYVKKQIMSNAEYSFYQVLLSFLDNEYTVFTKIRMIDIIGSKNAWQKVIQKHLDFVISKNNKALLAIELDDKSHNTRKDKDIQKNEILKSAGLPILRIKCQRAYETKELKEAIEPYI